jgi:gas vesicle protein
MSIVRWLFQGLNADTLLKRESTLAESESAAAEGTDQQDVAEDAVADTLQATGSDILSKLQEYKQEFYDKIKEFSDNLTELKGRGSAYLDTLKDNKQGLSDLVETIADNLKNFKQQHSELLEKLKDDKQKFEDKIQEVVSQLQGADKTKVTIPLQINSESLSKLKEIKQGIDNKLNKVKSEVQQKIQELKDKLEIQQQDGVSKRDLSGALAGDSVISILLSVPTSLASSFHNKFSEFKADANQVFENFVATLGGGLSVLDNLHNFVNSSVLANVTNISELASAASNCFQAQEANVENLVRQAGECLHMSTQVAKVS